MYKGLLEAHELLVESSFHVYNLVALLSLLLFVGLELFMPIMLLHLLYSLSIFASRGLEIALCRVVKLLAFDAIAAQFDGLVVTFLILFHDHLVVAVIVQILIHDDPLLDRLLQRRVSQVIDNASMHWSMANALIRLLSLHLLLLCRLKVEFKFVAHWSCDFLGPEPVGIFTLNVERQGLNHRLGYGVAEAQLLRVVS